MITPCKRAAYVAGTLPRMSQAWRGVGEAPYRYRGSSGGQLRRLGYRGTHVRGWAAVPG